MSDGDFIEAACQAAGEEVDEVDGVFVEGGQVRIWAARLVRAIRDDDEYSVDEAVGHLISIGVRSELAEGFGERLYRGE
jgi:hypothetical protein